jgi:hypothetical protein
MAWARGSFGKTAEKETPIFITDTSIKKGSPTAKRSG